MWAWENSHSIEESKMETLRVKDFGIQMKFKELIEGHFEADKYIGWELMAMTNHILYGIGGYRVQSDDHLEKYFLIVEQIDNELAQKLNDQIVDCDEHKSGRSQVPVPQQHHMTHALEKTGKGPPRPVGNHTNHGGCNQHPDPTGYASWPGAHSRIRMNSMYEPSCNRNGP